MNYIFLSLFLNEINYFILFQDAPPTNDVNVAGANDYTHGLGDEGNFVPFPEHADEFEGAGALPRMPSPWALRSASRSRLSAVFTVPSSANHSTGG
jgi:hypothetical protein